MDDVKYTEMMKRLVRIETRLVVLLEAHGIAPNGQPLDGQPYDCVTMSTEQTGETK